MRFSIIIPVFNAERYIGECLESLDVQTFEDYETIIIDDGSTDRTSEIIDEWAASHSNAIVSHKNNQGPLIARRAGMQLAQGEYIVFLDSDDCLKNNALETVSYEIDRHHAQIISFHASNNPDFSTVSDTTALLPGYYSGSDYNEVKAHICRGCCNNLWGKAFAASIVDIGADYSQYNGLTHGEDLLQLLPIIDRGGSFSQIDDVLYFYRLNDNSSTANFKASQLDDIVCVCRRLNEYAGKWGGNCIEAASVGEINQYVYLFKISELSHADESSKQCAFKRIAEAMHAEGAFSRAANARLRPDVALTIRNMEKGNRPAARRIALSAERFKRMLIGRGYRERFERLLNKGN